MFRTLKIVCVVNQQLDKILETVKKNNVFDKRLRAAALFWMTRYDVFHSIVF